MMLSEPRISLNALARPHRMVRILSAPNELLIVSRDQLEALAAETPAAAPRAQHHAVTGFDIDSFVSRHGLAVDGPEPWQAGRRWVFKRSPLCEHHDGAAFIAQHASGALVAKCHHNSCTWTWADLRARFEPKAPAKAAKKDTLLSPATVRIADVEPQVVEWLWPGRLAIGKVTLLAGDPGLGKSLLMLDIAARVSRGVAWPDAPGFSQPAGGVVLLSAEDDIADTIRPRLDCARCRLHSHHSANCRARQ